MNLDTLIDQWIGEEKQPSLEGTVFNPLDADPACIAGHNAKVQDLKSRKQELIEGIVGIIENYGTKLTDVDGQVYIPVKKFIKDLKSK